MSLCCIAQTSNNAIGKAMLARFYRKIDEIETTNQTLKNGSPNRGLIRLLPAFETKPGLNGNNFITCPLFCGHRKPDKQPKFELQIQQFFFRFQNWCQFVLCSVEERSCHQQLLDDNPRPITNKPGFRRLLHAADIIHRDIKPGNSETWITEPKHHSHHM